MAADKYENLSLLMHAIVSDPQRSRSQVVLIQAISHMRSDLDSTFTFLPGYENRYTPLSDYLFKLLQPNLADLLFLGTDYESLFDRFEVILALEQINLHGRGPIGRFGWKFEREGDSSPLPTEIPSGQHKVNSRASTPFVPTPLANLESDRRSSRTLNIPKEAICEKVWIGSVNIAVT
jgi:hypothetical protein